MPGPDDPAWANAGRPCGERGSVSAPLTWKNFPWKSTGRIRPASAHTAATSANSAARAYRSAASGCAASPKLPAAPAYRVVTTFHPARPPDT